MEDELAPRESAHPLRPAGAPDAPDAPPPPPPPRALEDPATPSSGDEWGHFSSVPEGFDEDDETSNKSEAASVAAPPEAPSRFDSSNFGACGARCAARAYKRTPSACAGAMGFEERSPERGEAPARRALRRSASLPELRARPASPGADRGGPCPKLAAAAAPATATSSTATTQFRLAIPGVDDVVYGVDVRRDAAPRRALAEAPPRSRRRRSARFRDDDGVERWDVLSARDPKSGAPAVDATNVSTNYRDGGAYLKPAFAPRSATRFFPCAGGGGVTVALAMGAVRVVATPFEKFAQYELRVSTDGGPPKSAWRRYSAFRAFMDCLAAESAPRRIVRTLSAWADAQDAKKVFRCTHPAYLVRRYYHFEHVLREALFEMESPDLLLSFFASRDARDGNAGPATQAAKRRARSDDAARRPRHAGPPGRSPFARSTERSIPGALPSDAASDAVSAAGTPAPRSSFLGAFLGVRDVKRVPVPSS